MRVKITLTQSAASDARDSLTARGLLAVGYEGPTFEDAEGTYIEDGFLHVCLSDATYCYPVTSVARFATHYEED